MKAVSAQTVQFSPPLLSVAVVHSRYQYKKVLDGRKQPLREHWNRNGKFITGIAMEGSKTSCSECSEH
jgi:hypothetical protein